MEPAGFGDTRGNHASLHDCQHADNAETQHGARFGMHTSKKESDHASTEAESHDAHREKGSIAKS